MQTQKVFHGLFLSGIIAWSIDTNERSIKSSGAAVFESIGWNKSLGITVFESIEVEHSGRSPPGSGQNWQNMLVH
jgi:hypothetical protein